MNKKFSILFIYFIFHLITCQLSAQPIRNDAVQIIESTSSHITVQVNIDSIQVNEKIVDQNTYHLVSISGFNFTIESGKPQLPATGQLLAIPPQGGVNLQIIDSQITTRSGLTVLPVAEQILDENSKGEPQFIIDKEFYSQDTWYPEQIVKIGEIGFIRDQRVAQVQISPAQCNPAHQMLRIYKSLTFRLSFDGTAEPGGSGLPNSEFERALQNLVLNYETGKKWRRSRHRSTALQRTNNNLLAAPPFKIYVKADGIYRLDKNDLEQVGILTSEIDPRTIKIFNRGQELPIYVQGQKDGSFDQNDYIQFYGQFNRGENSYLSPYSVSNVYWLSWGEDKGFRMADVAAGLYQGDATKFVSPNSHQFTQHFEQDKIFDRLLLVTDESRDHWFWETMNANQSYQFKFRLHNLIPGEPLATVKAKFHGSTHPSAYLDHHVAIKINDYLIAEASWDGQTEKYIESREVPNNIFKNGENILTIKLPGDTPAGEIDQVFFNWFEISYWRSFQAENDFIEFQAPEQQGLYQFEISNFHSKDIFIVDNLGRQLVNFDTKRNHDSTYSVIFQDDSHPTPVTYYVFSSDAVKEPEKIVADVPSDLRSPQNGADYILITHQQFREVVQPLADHRSSQGLRVKMVDVQDIYDEFSHGIFDPGAIQQFLQYAYENWTLPAPLYVLLAGDATWAYDKQVARDWGKPCFIPTVMKYTISWGLTSSDNAFVCVSGDDRLPDMFIGRLPLNSVEEAQIMINKILQYEQHPEISDWRKRVCLACGNGSFFEQSADYLYDVYIPWGFDVLRLYTNPKSKYFGSTEEMVGIFNNGVSLLNFIGHGGGGVFFDAELFLLEDVVLLNNADKLPVMFSLTCFIGYFDNPWTPSLGEELFRADGKGVIATFGSAGRAWLYGDYFLNNALFQSLFVDGSHNLGQVTTEAKWQMLAWSSSYWDHVENYNLLGDPALKIGFPGKEISMKSSNPSLKVGEALIVSGSVPGRVSGRVKLTGFDANDSLITESSTVVNSSQFQAQIQLPQNMRAGQGILKAYFWNENEDGIGTAVFSVESPCFTDVFTEPSDPGHQNPTYILAKIELSPALAPHGIDSVMCYWSMNQYSWQNTLMYLRSANLYRINSPIFFSEGTKVYYKFLVYYRKQVRANQKIVESRVYSYTVKKRADLIIPSPGISIGGQEQVIVRTMIKNNGETDAAGFHVEVFDEEPGSGGMLIGEKTYVNLLKAKSDTVLDVVLRVNPSGSQLFYVQLDQENRIDETSEYNNFFSKQFQLLTIKNGSDGQVMTSDSNFAITIPAASVSFNTAFVIKRKTKEDVASNYPIPQAFNLATLADGSQAFYSLDLGNDEAEIIKPFSVSFFSNSLVPGSEPQIYCWDEKSSSWSYRTSHVNSNEMKIYAETQAGDFLFGLFVVNDKTPPTIAIKVEDQVFANGDFVSSQPIISAVVEDESGVDIYAYPPVIKLNNESVPGEELVYAQSPNSKNTVLLKYSPTLSSGEYELTIQATDFAGNVGQEMLRLKISGEFKLQAIANHPNPFTEETIIAYTLTEEAQEVKIKIYTASGRLIRTFDFINEVGYIEHVWDGCDEMGDEVANGVYYMKFVALNGEKRIERVEKVAKIR